MKPVFGQVERTDQTFFRLKIKKSQRADFLWHFHDVYELNLMVSSHGTRFVGDHIAQYQDGDLVLMGPRLPHTWYSDPLLLGNNGIHHSISIQFTDSFLGAHLFKQKEWRHIGRLLARAARGMRFTESLDRSVPAAILELNESAGPQQLIKFLTILDKLGRSTNYELLSSKQFNPILDEQIKTRIDKVCRYLSENYTRPLALPEIASIANLSISAFCRFFKMTMGKTLVAYVNELRVGLACQMLVETEASIAEIAFESGFNNLSNFNRRFLEIKQISPSLYRRQFLVS